MPAEKLNLPPQADLRGKKFVFLSHEVEIATGFPAAFAKYLQSAGARLVYIRFPFVFSESKAIWIERFDGTKLLSRRKSWIRFYQPQLLSFAKDILWLMTAGWPMVIGADFVLASNNLMGLAALIFRKLGLIKSFSYLVVDYSPTRFKNPLVERLYIFLDWLVATSADSVWTMSLPMLEARERDGRMKLSEVTYRLAPMGNNADVIFANGEIPYQKHDLVFVGNPNAKNVRADFLLSVAQVLKQRQMHFRLVFVGPGNTDHLKKMADELNLTDRVVFRGGIPETLDLERFIAGCGLGMAPYDPNLTDNFSKFADPAKIKVYLGCGLPVVTTDVPAIARDVEKSGAGRVAGFSAQDYAQKIMDLWESDTVFRNARSKALSMGKEFAWPRIFDRLMIEEGLLAKGPNTAGRV